MIAIFEPTTVTFLFSLWKRAQNPGAHCPCGEVDPHGAVVDWTQIPQERAHCPALKNMLSCQPWAVNFFRQTCFQFWVKVTVPLDNDRERFYTKIAIFLRCRTPLMDILPFGLSKTLSNLQFRLMAPVLSFAFYLFFSQILLPRDILHWPQKTQLTHKLKHLLYIH